MVEVGKVGWLVGRGVEEEEKEEVGEPLEGRDEEEERSRLLIKSINHKIKQAKVKSKEFPNDTLKYDQANIKNEKNCSSISN